jgi:methionyl-tRNA formyltransferase
MLRLVYLGTPAFAVPTLERIVEAGHQVLEVVTQPDRPRGRGRDLAASPVKEAAARLGLPVYQPERVRRPEAVEHLRALGADAMVIVGYGQIIPQNIIDLAPKGIINVHASLLPKYRGAGPIQWAIINGETHTGVTTMRIDAGLDTGDMLLKAETEIGPDERAIELGGRLASMGAGLLVQTLAQLESIVPEKQDPAQATYAPILKKEDGLIDWSQSAQAIHNRVRGLQPWPGAYTTFRGQTLNIWKSSGAPSGAGHACGSVPDLPACAEASLPGRIASIKPLLIACGSGLLELQEVQIEGRKRISAADFANGQRLSENETLGEPRP